MLSAAPDGIRIDVRLTPKAAADRIQGLVSDADGRIRLKAGVTAPPEDGKANAALCALVAKRLKVAKGSVEVVSGQQSRNKTLAVRGPTDALLAAAKSAFDFGD